MSEPAAEIPSAAGAESRDLKSSLGPNPRGKPIVEIPHEQPIEPPVYKEIRPGKTRPATNIRHSRPPKRRGEEGELAFMRRAIAEGFAVAKPWGDSERYDVILDNGVRL